MDVTSNNHDAEIQGYSEFLIRACLEKNKDTYIKRFRNLPAREFNWCAAFLGTTWGGYRLMFRYCFIVWAVQSMIVAAMFLHAIFFGCWLFGLKTAGLLVFLISIILEITFFIIRGLFADELYFRFIKENIDRVKKQIVSEDKLDLRSELIKKTGVHWVGGLVMNIVIDIVDQLFWWLLLRVILYAGMVAASI